MSSNHKENHKENCNENKIVSCEKSQKCDYCCEDPQYQIYAHEHGLPLNCCSNNTEICELTNDNSEVCALPQITINGKKIYFRPGETIMQVAERAGMTLEIGRYCYHPALSIAGTCRMCSVEVEKAPKLMTACSTPAADGMVVQTQSEKVKRSREGVMEFLLANHPLDCPVCDQSGECSLQEYNYEYGPGTSQFEVEKRRYEESQTRKLSDLITLNMNRCIHCERCVRFCAEITKTNDIIMLNRGWHKEITLSDQTRPLHSDYQGCLADICPVGALTFNDFRFQKRVWFLAKRPSICDRCSRGCAIEVHYEDETIYRVIPRFNSKVNGHFICDEGRLAYHAAMNSKRITSPMIGPHAFSWREAADKFKQLFNQSKRILLLIGTDATNEEATALLKMAHLASSEVVVRAFNGDISVVAEGGAESSNDKPLDHLLRRSEKTPNAVGVAALGIERLKMAELTRENNYDAIIIFKNMRAVLPAELLTHLSTDDKKTKLALIGHWTRDLMQGFRGDALLLPGTTTYEKGGSYTNCDGIVQRFAPVMSVPKNFQVKNVEAIVNFMLS